MLKKGDKVIMHTCAEAELPKYKDKVFTCTTDEQKLHEEGQNYNVVWLEGFRGRFSVENLMKVEENTMDKTEALKMLMGLVDHELETADFSNWFDDINHDIEFDPLAITRDPHEEAKERLEAARTAVKKAFGV
jgi:hypothetical protein